MFFIELKYKDCVQNDSVKPISSEIEYDCIEEVIIDICEHLSDEDIVAFEVKGFQLSWPVDVCTDLATVIPQLPAAIASLSASDSCSIQFYEQGIERELKFEVKGEDVHIFCESLTNNWKSPIIELSPYKQVESMLTSLLERFLELGNKCYPTLNLTNLFNQEFQ